MEDYTEINSKTIDKWVENGVYWSRPVSHEVFIAAKRGEWNIDNMPNEWFPPLDGLNVLGLASGGGQQMPVLTALGAFCTLMDYSERQLAADRFVAEREGYEIKLVHADMTKRFSFEDAVFDFIFHPISNNYIEDVGNVWRESFRVLKPGGVFIAEMSNGLDFLFDKDEEPLTVKNKLPWNPLKMPSDVRQQMIDNYEGLEFSHSLEDNIGGMLKAGFILTDLREHRDPPGHGVVRDYMPQYYAVRAVKPSA